jgi:hypothetical protein
MAAGQGQVTAVATAADWIDEYSAGVLPGTLRRSTFLACDLTAAGAAPWSADAAYRVRFGQIAGLRRPFSELGSGERAPTGFQEDDLATDRTVLVR